VGVLRRAFVAVKDGKVLDFINPEILETSGEQQNVEGCLSMPGIYGFTTRPAFVKMRAQDRNGEFFEVEGTELLARELLHENDHLDGVMFSSKVIRYLTDEEIAAMNAGPEGEEEDGEGAEADAGESAAAEAGEKNEG
jgi:peptide deformylase